MQLEGRTHPSLKVTVLVTGQEEFSVRPLGAAGLVCDTQ